MSDARQRLLDALAEVERIDSRLRWEPDGENDAYARLLGGASDRYFDSVEDEGYLPQDICKLIVALHSLLPTLAALREVVEMHQPIRTQWDAGVRPVTYVEMCRGCRGLPHPCPTLRTLTRQFEEG